MTYYIQATHIFSQDDGHLAIIGFSDDEFEPSKFIILQKTHEYDEQDKQLGMDKVHIQIEDESRSKYGGIKAISLSKGIINITLDDETKSILKVDGDIEIALDMNNPEIDNVVSSLKTLFEADGIDFQG